MIHRASQSASRIKNKDQPSNASLLADDFEGFDQARRLERQQQVIEAFWRTPVNFEEPGLQKDIAPFIVMENTPMSKLHFLFIMLNMSQVNVVKKGVITGIITKLEFLQKKRDEQKIKKREQK